MSASQVPVTTVSLSDEEVSTSENTTGQFSEIVDIQVPEGFKYEFPSREPIGLWVYVHESKTNVGTGTNEVTLSNDLVNSPSVAGVPTSVDDSTAQPGQYSLVIWDDDRDQQTGVDAVDYAGDHFDYNNQSGTTSDLELFYLWGDSSQVEFRSYTGTEESFKKRKIDAMRNFHLAEVFRQPEMIAFDNSFTLREKHHLKIHVKTGVDLANWDDQPGDGAANTVGDGDIEMYSYSDIHVPVRRIPV